MSLGCQHQTHPSAAPSEIIDHSLPELGALSAARSHSVLTFLQEEGFLPLLGQFPLSSLQRQLPLPPFLLFFLCQFLLCLHRKDGPCQQASREPSGHTPPLFVPHRRGAAAPNLPCGSGAAAASPSAPRPGIFSAASESSGEESRKLRHCLPASSAAKGLCGSCSCQARFSWPRTGIKHHLLLLLLDGVQEAVRLHKYFRVIHSRQVIKSRVSVDLEAGKAELRAGARFTVKVLLSLFPWIRP